MTIIAAIHDTKKNIVWLGANGRATIGSLVAPSIDTKWIAINGWVIGMTGSGPKIEALKAHESECPDDAAHPVEILKFMKNAYGDFDIGETEEGVKKYSGSGLLVHRSGRIWDFDQSFCLTSVPADTFWAQGSGMEIAIGAAQALVPHVADQRLRMHNVIEITIAKDVDCPGEVLVQSFDRDGQLSAARQ